MGALAHRPDSSATRLTDAFSEKVENLAGAVGLHVMYLELRAGP